MNKAGDEYVFKLRPGLKFTDGTPFTADAVKWTIDRVVALKGDPSWLVTQFVKAVTVVDPLTVKFTLNGPTAFFPSVVAGNPPYYPLSPGVYPVDKIISDPTELKGGQLVGLGAYKITSFKRDEEVIFEANPAYYGKQPTIKKIIVRYFADATTMRLALEKGDVDLVYKSLNPSDIADLAKNPKIVTNKLPGPFIRFLCFETSESVFKDKNLRKAITALLDRPEINQKVYLGQNEPLYSLIPKGMLYHTEDFKTAIGDGNVVMAEKLLKAAGYSAAKPFDLRPLVYPEPLRRHRGQSRRGRKGRDGEDPPRQGHDQERGVGDVQAAIQQEADARLFPRLVSRLRRPGRLHGRLRPDRRLRGRGHLLLEQGLGRPFPEGREHARPEGTSAALRAGPEMVDRRSSLRPDLPGQPLRTHAEERYRCQDRSPLDFPLRFADVHEVIGRVLN